jgi:hypothetical protein
LALIINSPTAYLFGGGTLTNEWRVRFDALPTTEAYTARIGFTDDTTGADAVDGAYFRFSASDTHLVCVTRSNSSETTSTTTTVINVNQWYRLRIAISAGGSTAVFTIDDADTQSVGGAPNGAGRYTGLGASIHKSAGTTAESFSVDYCALAMDVTR